MSGFYIQASYSVLTFSVGATLLGQDMLYRSNRAEKNKYQVTVVPSVRALLKNVSVRLSLFIYSCFFFSLPATNILVQSMFEEFYTFISDSYVYTYNVLSTCKISAQRLQFELLSVTLGIGFVMVLDQQLQQNLQVLLHDWLKNLTSLKRLKE